MHSYYRVIHKYIIKSVIRITNVVYYNILNCHTGYLLS